MGDLDRAGDLIGGVGVWEVECRAVLGRDGGWKGGKGPFIPWLNTACRTKWQRPAEKEGHKQMRLPRGPAVALRTAPTLVPGGKPVASSV